MLVRALAAGELDLSAEAVLLPADERGPVGPGRVLEHAAEARENELTVVRRNRGGNRAPQPVRAQTHPGVDDEPDAGDDAAGERNERLAQPDPSENADQSAQGHEIRPLLQVPRPRRCGNATGSGGATKLALFFRSQHVVWLLPALHSDEGLGNCLMELRADVALELRQRLLLAQPGPVRAVT